MKKSTRKILTIIGAIIGVAVLAVVIIWFSLPSELRNMGLMMFIPGESYESYQEYQVIDQIDDGLSVTTFAPVAAESPAGDFNTNISTATEMVLNEDSGMLKLGSVQPNEVEDADYPGWELIADEGAADDVYPFGPSPLSYYTAGTASNLHTQIIRAAEVVDVELDNVTVEVLNTFRWDDMMSVDGQGFLDETYTNIVIESDASEETIEELMGMAYNAWVAGEALANPTVVEPALVVNGDNWDNYRAVPGTTASEVSIVDGVTVSQVTEVRREPAYMDQVVPEDDEDQGFSLDFLSNMQFEIFAISESANDPDRPYLKTVTISTPSSETWEILSDEFMSEDDIPVAPTSLEYFTLGTSLCLTSQMTLVSTMMDLEYTDYRVEHQFEYRQEDVNTADMAGYTDNITTRVVIDSEESEERLSEFYNRALSLCFAGEGLTGSTEMITTLYLNGSAID